MIDLLFQRVIFFSGFPCLLAHDTICDSRDRSLKYGFASEKSICRTSPCTLTCLPVAGHQNVNAALGLFLSSFPFRESIGPVIINCSSFSSFRDKNLALGYPSIPVVDRQQADGMRVSVVLHSLSYHF